MTSPAWRVVPVEATAGMHLAACGNLGPYPSMTEKWNAMIAARPRPDYDAMAEDVLMKHRGYIPCNGEVESLAAALQAYFEGE